MSRSRRRSGLERYRETGNQTKNGGEAEYSRYEEKSSRRRSTGGLFL